MKKVFLVLFGGFALIGFVVAHVDAPQQEAKAESKAPALTPAQLKAQAAHGDKPGYLSAGDSYAPAPVAIYLREELNDPDSLSTVQCDKLRESAKYWEVDCRYRAKNAFGALVGEARRFWIQHDVVVKSQKL